MMRVDYTTTQSPVYFGDLAYGEVFMPTDVANAYMKITTPHSTNAVNLHSGKTTNFKADTHVLVLDAVLKCSG